MALRDLLPWRKQEQLPVRPERTLEDFHREFDRLFEEFFRGFGLSRPAFDWPMGEFAPSVRVEEDDKEIRVTAELPGVEEKDVNVQLSDNALTISGEKKEEREEKGKRVYHSERCYGMFRRVIPLPVEVDEEKAEASFKNGVLTVRLPKAEAEEGRRKRIEVKAG